MHRAMHGLALTWRHVACCVLELVLDRLRCSVARGVRHQVRRVPPYDDAIVST